MFMNRRYVAMLGAASVLGLSNALAENFATVAYDPKTDQVVVTMLYRGTNPDHDFSLQWDECKTLPDGSNEVAAEVIDSQALDAAQQDFKKTVSLSLDGLPCRPAKVTLRAAPRSYVVVRIPAAPSS